MTTDAQRRRMTRSEPAIDRSGDVADAVGSAGPGTYPASESIALLMRIGLFGMRTGFKATLAKYKVPWSAWYYLRVLWETDGISQRELTERVGAMQPNTVSALKNMERAGFVAIDRPPDNKRSIRIHLTPKARRLMARILPEIRAATRPFALKDFSEAEELELRRLLIKICDNVRGASPTADAGASGKRRVSTRSHERGRP